MSRIGFVTCVKLGKSCIEEIYRIGGKLDLLVTLEDDIAKNKSGRIYLDDLANNKEVDLVKIKNINDPEAVEAIKKYDLDWLFIIGWSQLAKRELLDTPKKGCIGMHPTLLPVGRGRAAIPWAIIKGLDKTGVTLFKIDEGNDTGEIIGQEEILLDSKIDANQLYKKVNDTHITLISKYWDDICCGKVKLTKQNEENATYWEGRTPLDGELTSEMTIDEADKLIRATTKPYPGAFMKIDNRILRIWKADTSKTEGEICLLDGYLNPIDFEWEEL